MKKEALIQLFKSKGYEVINVIRLGQNGYPDYIAMKDGDTIWFECKKGKDTLKPLQKFRIDSIIKNGLQAFAMHEEEGIIYPENLPLCYLESI